jgi:hypothetical protein
MLDAPVGMWANINNQWKYFTPKDGTFTVPVQAGKLIYFYFLWNNDDTSGKG